MQQFVLSKQIFRIGGPASELRLLPCVSLVNQQAARMERFDQLAKHLAAQEKEDVDHVIRCVASLKSRQVFDPKLYPAGQAACILPGIHDASLRNVRKPDPPPLRGKENRVATR